MKNFSYILNLKLLLIIIYFIVLFYTLFWFKIAIYVGDYKLEFLLLSSIILLAFILLTFNANKYTSYNDFYIFVFWFFFIICSASLYLSIINAFLMNIDNIRDVLYQNKLFTFKLTYTEKYKVKFFFNYLKYFFDHNNTYKNNMETISLVLHDIGLNYINLQDDSLIEIKNRIVMLIIITNDFCEITKKVYEDLLFKQSLFYNIICFIKNSILTLTTINTIIHVNNLLRAISIIRDPIACIYFIRNLMNFPLRGRTFMVHLWHIVQRFK